MIEIKKKSFESYSFFFFFVRADSIFYVAFFLSDWFFAKWSYMCEGAGAKLVQEDWRNKRFLHKS